MLAALALLVRSPAVARACVLASPLALAASIALSGAGLTRPALLVTALALLTVSLAVAGGALLHRRALAVAFTALVAAYLVVLVVEPTWPALAAIGPTPGEGGRFYGSTNLTTSIVVAVTLFAGATFGLRGLVPVALLSLVTVGWSKAGADGGGLVVVAAGCAVLGIRLATGRLTVRAVALAARSAVGLGLALVGLDAATGGSSHVTRRVGDGPGALLGELGNRVHISVERLASSWHPALVFAIAIAALVILATRRPRFAAGEALLVAIGVSLVVNDTPHHVAAAGAISYGVLWTCERLDSVPMRRLPVIAVVAVLAVGLAGCGYEGETTASPETVEGTAPQPTETTTTETTTTETTETGDDRDRTDGDDDHRDDAGGRRRSGGRQGRLHDELRRLPRAVGRGHVRLGRAQPRRGAARRGSRRRPRDERPGRHAAVRGRADGAADRGRRGLRLHRSGQLSLLPPDFPSRVEALACDLDRTLIAADVELRPRTRAAIAAARAADVLVHHRHG